VNDLRYDRGVPRRIAVAALALASYVAACGPTRAPVAPAPATIASSAPASAREAGGAEEAPDPSAAPALGEPAINHVLSTGQSLAVGVGGRPPLTSEQPFENLMFATGVIAGREDLTSFVPLVEGDFIPGTEAATETMSSAFANLASGEGHHRILVSVHGAGAFPYFKLKKGTRPYETGLLQVAAARDLAKRRGKTYVVRAVTNVHGESDHAEKTTTYARDLAEWQADVERDVKQLTGQTEPVPMFHTQMSSWTRMMKGTTTSAIPQAQLEASIASGGKIVLVGPKYHLPYAKDGVHLSNEGYRHMGEDYAKAYRKVVLEKGVWEPLRPAEIVREGAVITVRFLVPSPPLVLDTTLVSDPGKYGFEYTDAAGSSPNIKKVELVSDDTVRITLDREPTAGDRRLRYAFTGTKGARSGPETGARGNLRDSDATVSRHGYALFNWCVHFEESVP
jgi:hypothetical protein